MGSVHVIQYDRQMGSADRPHRVGTHGGWGVYYHKRKRVLPDLHTLGKVPKQSSRSGSSSTYTPFGLLGTILADFDLRDLDFSRNFDGRVQPIFGIVRKFELRYAHTSLCKRGE